jgi:hypothetical protein
MVLMFRILLPLVDIDRPIRQLRDVHLGRILGLTSIRELALQKGDPPSELAGLPVSRG